MTILFVIPGDINLPTGGYRYDRAILAQWKEAGTNHQLISLPGNYPFPEEKDRQAAIDNVGTLPKGKVAIVDGLLGGANPEFLEALSEKMPVVALVHHPLCLESGLETSDAKRLEESERKGLDYVSAIVTTSLETANTVADLFQFDPAKVSTVLPGVARGEKSSGSRSGTLNLLCVGSVIERKGHRVLFEALARLQHLDWKLDCVGMIQSPSPLFDELVKLMADAGMKDRIEFHGAVEEAQLDAFYKTADLFVLPSLYEGYGMAYAEAIVRGIPVIGTSAGAIPDTVPEGCGILVPPQDIAALSHALETLISNQSVRTKCVEACLRSEPQFPTWKTSAHQLSQILNDVNHDAKMAFSSEWLSLREPIDKAARSGEILAAVADHFASSDKLTITDIACGTGSTVRSVGKVLRVQQAWRLIDNDPRLLAEAEKATESPATCTIADLSSSLDAVFDKQPDLVTTSAFLDLVSKEWLEGFVQELSSWKTPFYAALTYDGRAGCQPEIDADQQVINMFNLHQQTNKGFGPAMGPKAAETAERLLRRAGYEVLTARSDWRAGAENKFFQKKLLEGWCQAASEMLPERKQTFKQWLLERYRLIDHADASLFVGHVDLFAYPA